MAKRNAGLFKGGIIRGGVATRGSRGASISGAQAGTLGRGRGYGTFVSVAPGLSWGVKYTGFVGLIRMFSTAINVAPLLVSDRMSAAALEVFNESQDRVPVSSGRLKRSGYIKMPYVNVLEIGYTAPYALEVHEFHPTASKFLEDPFRRVFAKFNARFTESRDSNAVFLGARV